MRRLWDKERYVDFTKLHRFPFVEELNEETRNDVNAMDTASWRSIQLANQNGH